MSKKSLFPLKLKLRSKLEKSVKEVLDKLKLTYTYETERYEYVLPPRKYVIDFRVGDILLEVKGYLDYEERLKYLAVKKAHPELDIVFVFMKPNQKLPRQKMTHATWAEKNGFRWCSVDTLKDILRG